MVTNRRAWIPASFPAGVIAVVAASVLAFASSAWAQAIVEAVGGISINADGVLKNATLDGLGNLNQFWAKNLQKVPDGLGPMAGMRKVSLRNLEAAVEESVKTGKPLAQDIKFLGGLQAIRYVLVYPEQHDIVLVGPGEGWRVDTRGNLVGVTTGRPVMWLEDLLVALRSAKQAAQGGITCSIDPECATGKPTPQRDEEPSRRRRSPGGRRQRRADSRHGGDPLPRRARDQPLRPHPRGRRLPHEAAGDELRPFARPRIAQLFADVPPGGRAGTGNMMQRWWLEPKYESVLRDAEGLSWEFRGGSVQAMTEEDFLTANGAREHTGKANRLAQRWADNMTKKYNALAVAEPIFGQLQNCMELAIVGALIVKENLPAKTGNSLPALMDEKSFKTEEYRAPKEVDSKASILGRHIAVSGGVSIQSWLIVDRAQKSDAPTAVRAKATPAGPAWCWN